MSEKSSKIQIIIVTLLIVVAGTAMCVANPFKVTDPSKPGFNPDRFSFSDYTGNEETIEFFRKLFPVGTPKEFVDRVLMDAGDASTLQSKDLPQVWSYSRHSHPIFGPYAPHRFIFSENNTVENIKVNAGYYVYPDRITTEKLRENQGK